MTISGDQTSEREVLAYIFQVPSSQVGRDHLFLKPHSKHLLTSTLVLTVLTADFDFASREKSLRTKSANHLSSSIFQPADRCQNWRSWPLPISHD